MQGPPNSYLHFFPLFAVFDDLKNWTVYMNAFEYKYFWSWDSDFRFQTLRSTLFDQIKSQMAMT